MIEVTLALTFFPQYLIQLVYESETMSFLFSVFEDKK